MKRLAPLFLAVFVLVGTSTAFSVQAADDFTLPTLIEGLMPLPSNMHTGSGYYTYCTTIDPSWYNQKLDYLIVPETTSSGVTYYLPFVLDPFFNNPDYISLDWNYLGFNCIGGMYYGSIYSDLPYINNGLQIKHFDFNSYGSVSNRQLGDFSKPYYFFNGSGRPLLINNKDPFAPPVPDNIWDWLWTTDDNWGDFFTVRLPQLWNILFPKEVTDKEPIYTVTTPTPEPVEIYNPDGDLVFTIPVLPGGDGGGGFSLPDITINFPATEDDPAYELPLDIDQQVKLTVGSAQTLARENETQGALTSLVGGFPLDFVKFIGVASAIVLICGIVHRNLG